MPASHWQSRCQFDCNFMLFVALVKYKVGTLNLVLRPRPNLLSLKTNNLLLESKKRKKGRKTREKRRKLFFSKSLEWTDSIDITKRRKTCSVQLVTKSLQSRFERKRKTKNLLGDRNNRKKWLCFIQN